MLKDEIPHWAQMTFAEALNVINYAADIKTYLKKTYFYEQIKDRTIDGRSVEGLRGIDEGNLGHIGFRMADIFHEAAEESQRFLPMLYILKTVEKAVEKRGKEERTTTGILGRAYRSFASFLRDYDGYEKLVHIVKQNRATKSLRVVQNPALDAEHHADVLIECMGSGTAKHFYIWLYQVTERGLNNTIDRLAGNRGELPAGIHVLAPIKTEKMQHLEKKRRQRERKLDLVTKKERELQERKGNPRVLETTTAKLEAKLAGYRADLKGLDVEIARLSSELHDITDQYGWLLYSETYLQRVFNEILQMCQSPDIRAPDYLIFQRQLLYPRETVSNYFVFKKQ